MNDSKVSLEKRELNVIEIINKIFIYFFNISLLYLLELLECSIAIIYEVSK
ncbi:hypothetical protein MNB_SV-5-1800 [hydrothermal vent metagenome]|uniref:Uncharacterized protein n=1 Tax=hydrothermal vent metagenome TaxID=652676 RepID=A0A1W1EE03_9ZZZZ